MKNAVPRLCFTKPSARMSNSDSEILKLSRHFGMHVLVESVAGIYQELFAQLILIPIPPPLLHSILDGRTDEGPSIYDVHAEGEGVVEKRTK